MPSTQPGSILQFGDFELDCGRFELRRKGQSLRVERKPMELLMLLAGRDGQLVTRTEIAERLWSSEVFVDTEHGINTAVRKLRYVLRDDPDSPQFIQTVTGMGYRFIAPVTWVATAATAPPDASSEGVVDTVEQKTAGQEAAGQETAGRETGRQERAGPVPWRVLGWYAGAAACIGLALGAVGFYRLRHRSHEVRYTQLTEFTDSAAAPALSPDGRMLAFIRGGGAFLTADQIYVKMLPNGEPKQVTSDDRPKYGPVFSPDGSEIAYTVMDSSGFSTWEVSALGGETHLMLKNAAGLVWLDAERLLYSEIKSGIHMGVVTGSVTGSGLREIYFPEHERGMAHYSFPSPDRQWALVVEMKGDGSWGQCRLIALEGEGPSKTAGPAGACTSAGWNPDGEWMYFTATVEGRSHIWRQRFPDGAPEQLTSGPTEEDGVAMEPDGRALITSVGVHESDLWIQDGASNGGTGERRLSSEGEVVDWPSPPVFSPDASMLFYLVRRREGTGAELWRTTVDSGKSEAVFPGILMSAFDLSPDGNRVVYTAPAGAGTTGLWAAAVDRSSAAKEVANVSGTGSPHFGAHGEILFQQTEGSANYLERMEADGSRRAKVVPYPIEELQGVSPGRRWVTAVVSSGQQGDLPSVVAIPLDGGAPLRICANYCFPRWSTDGKYLFVPVEMASQASPGRTLIVPAGPVESLSGLPAGGIAPLAEASAVRGAKSVNGAELIPGKDPRQYAWVNRTVHRNLYRISLP